MGRQWISVYQLSPSGLVGRATGLENVCLGIKHLFYLIVPKSLAIPFCLPPSLPPFFYFFSDRAFSKETEKRECTC